MPRNKKIFWKPAQKAAADNLSENAKTLIIEKNNRANIFFKAFEDARILGKIIVFGLWLFALIFGGFISKTARPI